MKYITDVVNEIKSLRLDRLGVQENIYYYYLTR